MTLARAATIFWGSAALPVSCSTIAEAASSCDAFDIRHRLGLHLGDLGVGGCELGVGSASRDLRLASASAASLACASWPSACAFALASATAFSWSARAASASLRGLGGVEVARNLVAARRGMPATRGRATFGHQQVEQAEGDRQPDEPRAEMRGIERREDGFVSAAVSRCSWSWRCGRCRPCSFPPDSQKQDARPADRGAKSVYFTKSRMIATRKAKMPRPSASAAPMNARPNWPSAPTGCAARPTGSCRKSCRRRRRLHADGGEGRRRRTLAATGSI